MDFKPKPFHVYVHVTPNKRNGLEKGFTARVGQCDTMTEAGKVILDDRREMQNTFGGLVEGSDVTGRTYSVFEATWTKVA